MFPEDFKEGQVWAHRYGGTPEQNAHMLVKNIDGKLHLVNKYVKMPVDNTKPDEHKAVIFYCGEYHGEYGKYYRDIMKKEGYDGKS